MARIHIDNDDSLPDLADFLKAVNKSSPRKKTHPKPSQPIQRSISNLGQLEISHSPKPAPRRTETESDKGAKPRQRALKKVENNARLASASREKVQLVLGEGSLDKDTIPSRTPRRVARPRLQQDDEEVRNGGNKKEECDSDDSLPSPSKLFRKPLLYASGVDRPARGLKESSLKLGKFSIPSLPCVPASKETSHSRSPSTSRPTSSSDNDKSAFLI